MVKVINKLQLGQTAHKDRQALYLKIIMIVNSYKQPF